MGRSGHHLEVGREGLPTNRSVWVTTKLKPKPAGGHGPPTLNWKIRRDVTSDLVALADLSSSRVWLIENREAEATAQQHNSSYHHVIMVLQPGWTSAHMSGFGTTNSSICCWNGERVSFFSGCPAPHSTFERLIPQRFSGCLATENAI